jgi:hypothetical protein
MNCALSSLKLPTPHTDVWCATNRGFFVAIADRVFVTLLATWRSRSPKVKSAAQHISCNLNQPHHQVCLVGRPSDKRPRKPHKRAIERRKIHPESTRNCSTQGAIAAPIAIALSVRRLSPNPASSHCSTAQAWWSVKFSNFIL